MIVLLDKIVMQEYQTIKGNPFDSQVLMSALEGFETKATFMLKALKMVRESPWTHNASIDLCDEEGSMVVYDWINGAKRHLLYSTNNHNPYFATGTAAIDAIVKMLTPEYLALVSLYGVKRDEGNFQMLRFENKKYLGLVEYENYKKHLIC